jgi:hypothetical protein
MGLEKRKELLASHFLDLKDIYFIKGEKRRGWDSNPRYIKNVHQISNLKLSTTQPPLHEYKYLKYIITLFTSLIKQNNNARI